MKKRVPIRMCIACQKRELQNSLIRVQKRENKAVLYSGEGRSFYLCKACLSGKHISNIISGRMKIDKRSVEVLLKELSSNVENQN
jgi:predicted RNA-binding protein YlxR (DUF448 family)